VFPYRKPTSSEPVEAVSFEMHPKKMAAPKIGTAKPKVLITVFPGTNCEYDTARAFRRAGAEPEIYVIRNLSPNDIAQSAQDVARLIEQSQIVMLPGGFSGGDEPEGSAKLINSFFRGPLVAEAIAKLLEQRDGLMLGICNGFQALIKLGLLPYGKICNIDPDSPTLTFNTIGRHQSMLAKTRIASKLSPWLMHEDIGAVHNIAISHGEGRFVATEAVLETLVKNGQIAAQYVGLDGKPTMDVRYNPNGSLLAIEGITSPDGRVLGKMGHTERSGDNLYKNVPGNNYQKLFEGGVDYFSL
jgi:Phosphoribosylformylglycinamidine (FGAM) synthase, glutamine amidotransferase domain